MVITSSNDCFENSEPSPSLTFTTTCATAPPAPVNLQLLNATATTLWIGFEQPDDHGRAILDFDVKYCLEEEPHWRRIRHPFHEHRITRMNHDNNGHHVQILQQLVIHETLEANRTYLIEIRARNELGSSAFSTVLACSTKGR